MINKPCCIDINHDNEISDSSSALSGLDQVKAQGIFALIHKATEGTTFTDPRYNARRMKWMSGDPISVVDTDDTFLKLSPLWGAYAFGHGVDGPSEAKYFLKAAQLRDGDMPFLDWEAVGASGFQPSLEYADAFCSTVEDALGRVCAVYGGNVPRERFDADHAPAAVVDRFSQRPLWFCAYGGIKLLVQMPQPWVKTGAFLWQDDGDQYGPGPHKIPGISGYCDNSTVVSPMTFKELHDTWLKLTSNKETMT